MHRRSVALGIAFLVAGVLTIATAAVLASRTRAAAAPRSASAASEIRTTWAAIIDNEGYGSAAAACARLGGSTYTHIFNQPKVGCETQIKEYRDHILTGRGSGNPCGNADFARASVIGPVARAGARHLDIHFVSATRADVVLPLSYRLSFELSGGQREVWQLERRGWTVTSGYPPLFGPQC